MAETFRLPRIGDAMSEGEIVEWFVAVGDAVELDQTICSIETDKSVVELTTPFRGTVLRLGGSPGDVVEVGAPLIVVGAADETTVEFAPPEIGTAPAAPGAASVAATPVSSPLVRRLADQHAVDLTAVSGSGLGGRVTRADVEAAARPTTSGTVRAMPKVRKLARERAIDLGAVVGTGPAGSITVADVEAIVGAMPAQTTAAGTERAGRRERLSAMRRSIAHHLTESVRTIPQFTSTIDVDATSLVATRTALRERTDDPMPLDALLMAFLIPVLRDHPRMNAHLDGDEIVFADRYDIGVAVDTPDGLIVPVVIGADQRPIDGLASEIDRLATAARERRIQPSDLAGATCTLNNVGAVGIETGTPILPLGTSTIVAVGRSRPVVQLRNGNPVEVPMMTVCATFDHRLIDGGDAGRFLTQFKRHLEVPALGLL